MMDARVKEISTPTQLRTWLRLANKGDRAFYHVGFLWEDRVVHVLDNDNQPVTKARQPIHGLAQMAWQAHEMGLVRLFQEKLGHGDYLYMMERTRL